MAPQTAAKFKLVSIWALSFLALSFLVGEYMSGQIVQGHLTLALSFVFLVAAFLETKEYYRAGY